MRGKEIYELTGAVAEALPDPMREQFAALMMQLAVRPPGEYDDKRSAVRRWLRDAGWVKRQ